jgi:hypothetical protein
MFMAGLITVRRILVWMVLACAPALPASGQGVSTAGPAASQDTANGQPARVPELQQPSRARCNQALELYVDHGGPIPPASCRGGAIAPSPSSPSAAGYGRESTNCTSDANGERHCVTSIPGKPLIFMTCAPGPHDGEHCDPK